VTKNIRYVGLDVHAATIAVAVTEGRGEVRSLGQIPNTPEAVAKLVKKLGTPASSTPATRPAPPATPCIGSSRSSACIAKSSRLRSSPSRAATG
jgi:hypothetical protein